LISNGQKRLVFGSNDQIRIQTVEFEFKRINQEVIPHYRPPALAAGGIARAVEPDPAPTRALLPAPTGRKPWRPLSPPHHPERAVVPEALALAPLGRALLPPDGTSLTSHLIIDEVGARIQKLEQYQFLKSTKIGR
jgi:hypothetical protein